VLCARDFALREPKNAPYFTLALWVAPLESNMCLYLADKGAAGGAQVNIELTQAWLATPSELSTLLPLSSSVLTSLSASSFMPTTPPQHTWKM